MLKRTKKIRQYTNLLKAKRAKQTELKNHQLLLNRVESEEPEVKEEHESHRPIQIEEEREPACWDNSDAEQQISIKPSNHFRKFANQGLTASSTMQEYQSKMAKMYAKKFQKQNNWAQEGETIEQKDVNDFLNEEVFYGTHSPTKKVIRFQARTQEKHESVVSGLDWHNNVMFSCGLDHKVKVWSFHPKEGNPELKLRKEKDIYFGDLPLSNCTYRDGELVMGTLRKNLVLLDCEKWAPTYITSSFLKEHKSYQNMRASRQSKRVALFDGMRVSILDKNNVFAGSLLANEQITDFTFNESNQNLVNAVTDDGIYEWDLRKFQVSMLEKKYLGFTSIAVNAQSVAAGSKLGTVYIYDANNIKKEGLENNNLVTHVTQIRQNPQGDLMVAISRWKSNSMRVIDANNGRSVGEWPGPNTKVGMAMQASFNQWNHLGVGSSHGYVNVFAFNEEAI